MTSVVHETVAACGGSALFLAPTQNVQQRADHQEHRQTRRVRYSGPSVLGDRLLSSFDGHGIDSNNWQSIVGEQEVNTPVYAILISHCERHETLPDFPHTH